MLITRTSPFSGRNRSRDIPITAEQLEAWQNGTLIQHAMPHLDADQREFILTGITDDEWDEAFDNEWDETFGNEADGEHQ